MSSNPLIAADSAREYIEFGRLKVADNRISKAMVNGYYGREIAGYEQFNLDPDKEYMLLRDPDELAKSTDSFKGVPLLTEHILDTADSPATQERCGFVGDDVRFEFPYLVASLVIWNNDAIAGIETGEQREISCSYKYTLDMTPGEFEGIAYDGVMRNIVGNHVAIVPNGRVGRDAIINDSKPQEQIVDNENKDKPAAYDSNDEAIKAVLAEKGLVGDDGEVDGELIKSLVEALGNVAADNETGIEPKAEDTDPDDENIKPESIAGDTNPKAKAAIKKVPVAMDASTIRKEMRQEFKELRQAERACEPLIGIVACDSADEVYRMTLRQYGVAGADTIHSSALPAMVDMLKSQQSVQQEQPVAMDANQRKVIADYFGGSK